METINKRGRSARRKTRTVRRHIATFIFLFITKLPLYELSVSAKITLARRILEMMVGNPNFPDPTPPLADGAIVTDALEVTQAAMPGNKAQTEARDAAEQAFDEYFLSLQKYVEFKANGNRSIVLSSGMDVRNINTEIGILPPPEWMKANLGLMIGNVDLKWKPVKKNSGYRIEWTTDPALVTWPHVSQAEKASATISGLTPGVRYYFRIATLSHAGFNGYCEYVTVRVPLD